MRNSYPITISLKNELRECDNPVARMIVELVGEYELRDLSSAVEVFEEELGERLGQACKSAELSDFCLRLYSAVAKDIAISAQDHDFDNKRQHETTVRILLSEFESKMHNRDEHGEPMEELLRTTSPTDIPLYSARGSVTVPAGSTAYDLGKDSELPDEVLAELICDAD